MVIGNSRIGMESAREYSLLRMDTYSLRSSKTLAGKSSSLSSAGEISNSDGNMSGTGKTTDAKSAFQDSLNSLKERFEQMRGITRSAACKKEQDAISRIKAECINYLLQLLLGKNALGENGGYELSNVNSTASSSGDSETFLNTAHIAVTYEEEHYFSESESTAFKTTGTVVTKDGREIDFNLEMNMTRSFENYSKVSMQQMATVLCDPLVINLDSDIAEVSDQKILFDIDADGKADKISSLGKGSGYLSLDINGDGIINDGSELFGTSSGDGFADLAQYDSDGNGWIDEADEIFNKLRICSFDENGKQTLYSLKDKGVGALYLGSASTNFSLTNNYNEINAVIRKTGMFLYEDGNAGTLQHVDMAKEETA